MVDLEIVREWLAKADEDFEFARINFQEGKIFSRKSVSISSRHPRSI